MDAVSQGKKCVLLTGAVRSGKSAYALTLAKAMSGKKFFLATAEALDEEMRQRVANHRAERAEEYATIEEPVYIAEALQTLKEKDGVVIIDCLTVWVNNLIFKLKEPKYVQEQKNRLIKFLQQSPYSVIMVTNEVGMGIVPPDRLSRWYIEELGRLNQELACLSDEVILMIAGIAQKIKG